MSDTKISKPEESTKICPDLPNLDEIIRTQPIQAPLLFVNSNSEKKPLLLPPQNMDNADSFRVVQSFLASLSEAYSQSLLQAAPAEKAYSPTKAEDSSSDESPVPTVDSTSGHQKLDISSDSQSEKSKNTPKCKKNLSLRSSKSPLDDLDDLENMDFLDEVPQESTCSLLKEYKYSFSYTASKGPGRRKRMIHCGYGNCKKTFHKAWNFVDHARVHLGIKPYQCKKCDKSFTQKGNLRKHERVCKHN